MTTKRKRTFIAWCVMAILAVPIYIISRDWGCLVWLVTCGFLLYQLLRMADLADEQTGVIDKLYEMSNNGRLTYLENQNELLLRMCESYLNSIKNLKSNLEYYRTLNKNLLKNQNTGVKNYVKNTHRRATTKRN